MASSLDDALKIQDKQSILISNGRSSDASGATSTRLNIALVNETSSSSAYAFITGLAINNNNAVWLLESDGQTDYYPSSPSSNQSALAVDCAIPLGAPGNTVTVSIPQVAGGRIWFSTGSPLTFLLNEGPALVEPSVTNSSDPNINLYWDFCEFTYNASQMFCNISYVDFVCLPIALDLAGSDGSTQHVSGMASTGLDSVCSALQAQAASDGEPWDELVVTLNGANLRAISPNNGIIESSSRFSGYYESYVSSVWSKYTSTSLNIDTQASYGTVSGTVSNNVLSFGSGLTFSAPSTADIFSCSSGPFATGSNAEVNAIIPRLAAGFNRSTLLIDSTQPDSPSEYYLTSPTNHYSRITHLYDLDGLGYGFPYDDVIPDGSTGVEGAVSSSVPTLMTVTVGGGNAHTKRNLRKGLRRRDLEPINQAQALIKSPQEYLKRDMSNEKAMLMSSDMIDLERGDKLAENQVALRSAMPLVLKRIYDRMAPQLDPMLNNAYVQKVISGVTVVASAVLSAGARAFMSRVILAVLVLFFYMTIELFNKSAETGGDAAPRQ